MNEIIFLQDLRNNFLNVFFMPAALPLEEFSIPLIAWFIWIGNRKFGWKSMLMVLSGMLLSIGAKNIFRISRPWILNSTIIPLYKEGATGYSFPSGHSAFAVLFCYGFLYPLIAKKFKRKWIPALICLVPTLYLMISRIYYGVHSPLDIISGALLGICWLVISKWILNLSEKKASRKPLLVFFLPLILSIAASLIPIINSAKPFIDDTVKMAAMSIILLPLGIIEAIKDPLENKLTPFAKWAVFCTGILAIFAINSGAKMIMPDSLSQMYLNLLEFLRYTFIAIFAGWLFPLAIKMFKAPDKAA